MRNTDRTNGSSRAQPLTPSPRRVGPIEWLPLTALRANPRNARTHSRKQVRQIALSIRTFGFTNPIIIDEKNMILAGNGRWEAARLDGIGQIPTLRLSDMSDAQKRAYVLADNKIALESGWDREILAIELGELADLLPVDGLDVTLTGFAPAEIDVVIADMALARPEPEDSIPVSPVNPVARSGDVWLLGGHRLLCGDARDRTHVTRLMNDEKAACVFTDPPYNVKISHIVGRGRIKHDEFAFASGEMSDDEFRTFLTATLGNAALATRNGAIHYVCMDWKHVGELIDVGRGVYGAMLNLVVWNKTNAGQGSFYRSQHELIGVFRVGQAAHRNNVELGKYGRNRSNVWTYPGINSFGRRRLYDLAAHPTVKPVALVADALLDSTAKGDLVLDPFIGSGTTILAAEKVGRRCCGLEYEPRYIDVAIRRWEMMTKLEAVLEGDGRCFEALAEERLPAKAGEDSRPPEEQGDLTDPCQAAGPEANPEMAP